jgi:NADH-quinone oxidoreductase subunit A
MAPMNAIVPVFLFVACVFGLAVGLLAASRLFNPARPGAVHRMPYESGMDPVHDTRRRFDVRFHLMAIAFLVFDVELLFLYPWAVATRPAALPADEAAMTATTPAAKTTTATPTARTGIDAAVAGGLAGSRDLVFAGAMVFVALLAAGFLYDWRKGVFQWR